MITAGIDVGTKDTCIIVSDDGKILDYIKVENLKENVNTLIDFLRRHDPHAIGCGFGYGLPIKRLSELNERDIAYLTLSFEKEMFGVRRFLNELKQRFGDKSYTVPSVKLLPTVPMHRKFNKIDMGTSDKVCSVALALERMKNDYVKQNFVLVEGGYGFNSFIAVKGGKIVDGLGGTSGFLSFSSSGALDLEVASLIGNYRKELIFKGGLKSLVNCEIDDIPDYALEWLFEYVMKGVKIMEVSIGEHYEIVVSGRIFDMYWREFEDFTGCKVYRLESVKSSAEGACLIANGIIGGVYSKLLRHLELDRAKGSVLDFIAEDLRKLFKYPV